jgi:tryptophan-rich sensory protein
MAISGWRVWRTPDSPERTRALALWGGQLALNGAWSAAFFGAKSPTLALADIALLDGAIVAYTHQASKVDKPAAWMFAPYIGWTGFATALNTSIVRLNA